MHFAPPIVTPFAKVHSVVVELARVPLYIAEATGMRASHHITSAKLPPQPLHEQTEQRDDVLDKQAVVAAATAEQEQQSLPLD